MALGLLGQQHSFLMVRLCPNTECDFPFFEGKEPAKEKEREGKPSNICRSCCHPISHWNHDRLWWQRGVCWECSTQIHKWGGGTPSFPDVYFRFMDSFSPGFPRRNISRPAVSGSLPCGIAPSIWFFPLLFIFNQSITALQCWVGFYQTSTSHTYVLSLLNLEPIIQSEVN